MASAGLPFTDARERPLTRIVPIDKEHLPGFHAALDRIAREGRYLATLQAPSLGRTRRVVLDSLRHGAIHVVALAGREVVGWCDLRPRPVATQAHCAVLGMGVVAECRGQGIGAGMLTATLGTAEARGIRRVELVVRTDNAPAIGLYRRFGFEIEGTCRRYLCIDGVDHDVLMMARLS